MDNKSTKVDPSTDIPIDRALFEEAIKLGKTQSKSINKSLDIILDNIMKKGMIIQDALGISNEVIENLYNQIYQIYQSGQYFDASKLFRLLILLRPGDMRFAFGLASCLHMLKEYQFAIEAYTKCSLLDLKDPLPFYHASDCYTHLDNSFAAIISLEMALKRVEGKPEFAQLKQRARVLVDNLRRESQEKAGG